MLTYNAYEVTFHKYDMNIHYYYYYYSVIIICFIHFWGTGVTDEFYRDWVRKTSYRPIVYIEKGTLSKCGRDGNAHAVMSDGTQLCVRNSRHGNLGLLGKASISCVKQCHNSRCHSN